MSERAVYVWLDDMSREWMLEEFFDGRKCVSVRPLGAHSWGPPVTLVRQSGEVSGL